MGSEGVGCDDGGEVRFERGGREQERDGRWSSGLVVVQA